MGTVWKIINRHWPYPCAPITRVRTSKIFLEIGKPIVIGIISKSRGGDPYSLEPIVKLLSWTQILPFNGRVNKCLNFLGTITDSRTITIGLTIEANIRWIFRFTKSRNQVPSRIVVTKRETTCIVEHSVEAILIRRNRGR